MKAFSSKLSSFRIIGIIIFAVLVVCYPLIVFFGVQHFSPAIVSFVLILLSLLKLINGGLRKQAGVDLLEWLGLAGLLAYSLCILLTNSELLLRFYPAAVSFSVAAHFYLSLNSTETIIEKFARKQGHQITDLRKQYMRALTKIWVVTLLLNALIACYLAIFGSLTAWAFYCGFLSYCFMGLLMAAEYAYRIYFRKKHEYNIE